MNFTAKDVAALREKTGCGMMDCKKALTASEGDMEKAIDFLREKGLAASVKKAGRIAAEGVAFATVSEDGKVGVVIEVNAETDFVAKNADFQAFVKTCADTVIEQNPADVEALLACKASGTEETVDALLKEKILTIGENIKIRRFARYEGAVTSYVHAGGRIGVIVKFDTTDDIAATEGFKAYAHNVAMQIAAMNAEYLDEASVPAERVEKEKEILTQQIVDEGKPANIAEKIVAGRLNKFFKEICLVDQVYVQDSSMTVKQYTLREGRGPGEAPGRLRCRSGRHGEVSIPKAQQKSEFQKWSPLFFLHGNRPIRFSATKHIIPPKGASSVTAVWALSVPPQMWQMPRYSRAPRSPPRALRSTSSTSPLPVCVATWSSSKVRLTAATIAVVFHREPFLRNSPTYTPRGRKIATLPKRFARAAFFSIPWLRPLT